MPVVSVVMPTLNAEKYLAEAIDSILKQTFSDFEFLIIDGGSVDKTVSIIKSYQDKRIRLLNGSGKNIAADLNIGLEAAVGKYIARMDADDVALPERFAKQVDFLDAHPECSICFHPVKVTWDDGRENDTIYPDATMLKKVGALNFENLLKRNFIQTSSVVYRWRFHKDSYDQIPDGVLPGDWFLHLLHAQIGQIGFLPEVMAVYRRNAGGIWTGAEVSPQWFCRFGKAYMRFWDSVEKQFGVNKLKEREFLRRAVFYANLYCKRDNLDEKYEDIKAPYEKAFLNILELFFLRCLKKITSGKTKDLYSAKYRSLKLYNSWLKDKAHLKTPVND